MAFSGGVEVAASRAGAVRRRIAVDLPTRNPRLRRNALTQNSPTLIQARDNIHRRIKTEQNAIQGQNRLTQNSVFFQGAKKLLTAREGEEARRLRPLSCPRTWLRDGFSRWLFKDWEG